MYKQRKNLLSNNIFHQAIPEQTASVSEVTWLRLKVKGTLQETCRIYNQELTQRKTPAEILGSPEIC